MYMSCSTIDLLSGVFIILLLIQEGKTLITIFRNLLALPFTTSKHCVLPRHPMPLVLLVLIRDAWEICLMFCKKMIAPLHKMKHIYGISPMHCIIKTHRQNAWDDGVVPSVNVTLLYQFLLTFLIFT